MERFCNTIIRQIDALSDIASIFSYYAKMPAPLFQYIDLKEILSGAIAIYDNSGVQFRVSGFENCHLNADPSLILRVFNNLIKNAIEAIEIKEQGIVSINAIKTNTTVVVTMLDNGQGIEPDVLKRIFVPTFTTRSSGMGLGLPMVKTIIEEHNGEINITSEKGKGTTITIVFRL
jgi:nitrogen fixation/metabolism regulation signal transduction histidine kinase